MWRDFLFNFSRTLSSREKIFNIWFAFSFSVFWMLVIVMLKLFIAGSGTGDLGTCWIDAQIDKALVAAGVGDYVSIVIRAVVLAPLIEEHLFRCLPLVFLLWIPLAQGRSRNRLVLEGVLFSSVLFGLMHGSPWNVALQGVLGVVLCWVYLKNNLSRWSPIIVHSLYNIVAIMFTLLTSSAFANIHNVH